jgi:hypothetical protein
VDEVHSKIKNPTRPRPQCKKRLKIARLLDAFGSEDTTIFQFLHDFLGPTKDEMILSWRRNILRAPRKSNPNPDSFILRNVLSDITSLDLSPPARDAAREAIVREAAVVVSWEVERELYNPKLQLKSSTIVRDDLDKAKLADVVPSLPYLFPLLWFFIFHLLSATNEADRKANGMRLKEEDRMSAKERVALLGEQKQARIQDVSLRYLLAHREDKLSKNHTILYR